MTTRRNSVPKSGARIHCGDTVRVIRGQLRGREGQAMLLVRSMWLVDFGDRKASLHRRQLKAVAA